MNARGEIVTPAVSSRWRRQAQAAVFEHQQKRSVKKEVRVEKARPHRYMMMSDDEF